MVLRTLRKVNTRYGHVDRQAYKHAGRLLGNRQPVKRRVRAGVEANGLIRINFQN